MAVQWQMQCLQEGVYLRYFVFRVFMSLLALVRTDRFEIVFLPSLQAIARIYGASLA